MSEKRKPGYLWWWKAGGGFNESRHCVWSNWPSGMQEGVSIGLTGSPGIWEPWRERGHVTSTHHQLYQILLAQLAGSGVISQFPKAPGEISCSLGPSSKRTGDRFKGWSGLLGSDKEQKLKPLRTPTHITSDEINLPDWIQNAGRRHRAQARKVVPSGAIAHCRNGLLKVCKSRMHRETVGHFFLTLLPFFFF